MLADKYQRNPKYGNIFSVGVCVAIPPYEATPVAVGMPKTGYMIELMVTATAHNIRDLIAVKAPTHVPSWNAVCLADFGDSGVAFVALPQIPPRNVNWSIRATGCISPRSASRNISCERYEKVRASRDTSASS